MLFNRCNKNSINKFKWKFEYEDTVYKVYDWNNNLAGYFFPNYNLIQKQNGTKRNEKQQEEGEVIEEMNKLHENVRGGNLMIPMLRLNLLDNEEGNERMNCQYDGEDMQIAFNARFLIEMLNAAETSDIKVELAASTKAGIIKPTESEENEELLMLVMPLMLNS